MVHYCSIHGDTETTTFPLQHGETYTTSKFGWEQPLKLLLMSMNH